MHVRYGQRALVIWLSSGGNIMQRPTNSRDTALELVEDGMVSAEDMLTMALKYMSTDDVADMLDCNELSERFMVDG